MTPRPTYLKRTLKLDGSEGDRRKYDCTHYTECLIDASEHDGHSCRTFVCDNCEGEYDLPWRDSHAS